MLLMDAEILCAFARFCDPQGSVWNLIQQTDNQEAPQLVSTRPGIVPAEAWSRRTESRESPSNRSSDSCINRRHSKAR